MRQQAAIGAGGGMMKFVDDDVIEMLRREALDVLGARQCLNRRAKHIGFRIAVFSHVKADSAVRSNA